MDLWDPDFCKLFPIPEEVLSLVDEVSDVHEPISVTDLENSSLPANSPASLLPGMHVVQPELPCSTPLCSPQACNSLPMLLKRPNPPTKVANLEPPEKKSNVLPLHYHPVR